jgi:hypothetical protein
VPVAVGEPIVSFVAGNSPGARADGADSDGGMNAAGAGEEVGCGGAADGRAPSPARSLAATAGAGGGVAACG